MMPNSMKSPSLDFLYQNELPQHAPAIIQLHEDAFGPGRFTRAAFLVRKDTPHTSDLSFVAHDNGLLVGSVRLTLVRIGEVGVQLLGPLAVSRNYASLGIGKQLMFLAMEAAMHTSETHVMLVGDLEYYAPFGFRQADIGSIRFPAAVDPYRILMAMVGPDGATTPAGDVKMVQ